MKTLFYQFTGLIMGLVIGLSVAATAVVSGLFYMYYSVSKEPAKTKDYVGTNYRSYPKGDIEKDPVFGRVYINRSDAEDVVRAVQSLIDRYGRASVADFKEILGIEPKMYDVDYGWTTVHGTTYWPMTSGGVKIRLPKIEKI